MRRSRKKKGGGNCGFAAGKKKKRKEKTEMGRAAWRRWGGKCYLQARCVSPPHLRQAACALTPVGLWWAFSFVRLRRAVLPPLFPASREGFFIG